MALPRSERHTSWLLTTYLRPHRLPVSGLAATMLLLIALRIATPIVTGRFIDGIIGTMPMSRLVELALLVMALSIATQLLSVAETWLAESISWSATNALRLDLVAHVLRLDAGFHASRPVGDLIERVDGDVGNLSRFFSRFVVLLIGNALFVVIVLATLAAIDWQAGLTLAITVGCVALSMQTIRHRAAPRWEAERTATTDYYGFIGEAVTGADDLRSSAAVPYVMTMHARRMRNWLQATRRAQILGYGLVASSQALMAIGMALCLALAAMRYLDGTMTLGTVFLVYRLVQLLREPIAQLRNEIEQFQQAAASIDRVSALLATESTLIDAGTTPLPAGPLSIEITDVSFGYGSGADVLQDIQLALPAGRVLGVVGHTGGGKTTLTRLIGRFHDPTRGAVRVGGVDVRDVALAELRSRIGIVNQDVRLFDATVRDNLTLWDRSIADDRLRDVLRDVGLGSWLDDLPAGLETRIASQRAGLSAGQAQLLACARLLLIDPDIVILDEASARLDPATERVLHDALERVIRGRTAIVVAHRLSTMNLADDIVVIERGKIVEKGPRDALAANPSSRFAELVRTADGEVLA